MESKFHRWWLGSCVAALLLASWVGGFSIAVTSVFIVIYLTGVTLIGSDDAAAAPMSVVAAHPVDVVAADPEWLTAYNSGVPADSTPGSAEGATEGLAADTETVVLYESAAAEPEAPVVEEALVVEDTSDAEVAAVGIAVVVVDDVPTTVADDDAAVPYPDDFEDEKAAAELEERSPA